LEDSVEMIHIPLLSGGTLELTIGVYNLQWSSPTTTPELTIGVYNLQRSSPTTTPELTIRGGATTRAR
jgi:hypothetical protein